MQFNSKPYQRVFLVFCRYCLLATYFKRYWPVNGAVWNESKIDKNNSSDLKRVISDAYKFTRQHIQLGLLETALFFIYFLFGSIESNKIVGYAVGVFVLHGYPLCIHEYNRILARQQLDWIKRNDCDTNIAKVSDSILSVEPVLGKKSFVVRFGCVILSPAFETEKEAQTYCAFVRARHATEFSLNRLIFLHGERKLYREFENNEYVPY
jgi:hypothetical protein